MAETKVSKSSLHQTLLNVQRELPKLTKDAKGVYDNKYVTLHQLLDKVIPILNKHGLVLLQYVQHAGDQHVLQTVISDDVSANTGLESATLMTLKSEDPQAQGSAITYARRYALMSMLGMVGEEDDDGQRATEATRSTPKVDMNPPATDKQKNYIKVLYKNSGQPEHLLDEYLTTTVDSPLETLTQKQASQVIKELSGE